MMVNYKLDECSDSYYIEIIDTNDDDDWNSTIFIC